MLVLPATDARPSVGLASGIRVEHHAEAALN
jgi:hypothetical protein